MLIMCTHVSSISHSNRLNVIVSCFYLVMTTLLYTNWCVEVLYGLRCVRLGSVD